MVPQPISQVLLKGSFRLDTRTSYSIPEAYRKFTALPLSLIAEISGSEFVPGIAAESRLRIEPPEEVNSVSEAYRLEIKPDQILIEPEGPLGIPRALSSLVQLIAAGKSEIPAQRIEDRPAYPWRGFHLDVGRHFFGPGELKRLLLLISLYKYNTFHWHLTEDQGWRPEIEHFPELVSRGAYRTEKDGSRHGGYYSRQEMADLVDYADSLGIRIIPEIELPGHAQAAVAVYPKLSCTEEAVEVWNEWGISEEVYCAGKEETFAFLEAVFTDLSRTFPSPVFHIGGDECPKAHWESCPACRKRIAAEGLADAEELQSYFIRRVQGILKKLGKTLIGWDEILEGGLAPGAMVMSWRGSEGGIVAARAGHQAVMTPERYCYLDHPQTLKPDALGPNHFDPPPLLLKEVYDFDPTDGVPPEYRDKILGSQVNTWTEAMDSWERVEHMVFPRALAMAESLWNGPEEKEWKSFRERLEGQKGLLDAFEVAYCPDPEAWGRG